MKIPYKLRSLIQIGDILVENEPGSPAIHDYEFDLPTSWQDLTFEQGSRLFIDWFTKDKDDIFMLMEILSGVSHKVWFNAIGDVDANISSHIKFLSEIPNLAELPMPKSIKIGEKNITLPTNLGLQTFGQKVMLQEEINKHLGKPHDMLKIAPMAVAVYAYPGFYEAPLDSEQLKTFSEMILQCNFLDVYSAGRFFFLRSVKSSAGNQKI
jgi:hypothetical protein